MKLTAMLRPFAAAATAAAVAGEEVALTQRVVEEEAAPRRHNAPHRLPTQRLTQPLARRLGVREMQPVLNSVLVPLVVLAIAQLVAFYRQNRRKTA